MPLPPNAPLNTSTGDLPPDLRPSLETLLESVRALYGAMALFDASAAASLGVDRTAVRAANLMEHGPVSPGHLGEALGLSSGAVTALLHRLEEAGHIRRVPTDDGRRRDAQLTPSGRRAAHREFERLGRTIAGHFADRDPPALQQLARDMDQLARAFLNAAQGGPGRGTPAGSRSRSPSR